jgi:hypothetical protein
MRKNAPVYIRDDEEADSAVWDFTAGITAGTQEKSPWVAVLDQREASSWT